LCQKYLKNMKSLEPKQIMKYETFSNSDFKESINNAFGAFLDDMVR
jgi:hypothetical protein